MLYIHVYSSDLIHIELAQVDRNEVWAWNLYHLTVLVEAAKSLALSNVIGHGYMKVSYQKPLLKSMTDAVHLCSTTYIAMY